VSRGYQQHEYIQKEEKYNHGQGRHILPITTPNIIIRARRLKDDIILQALFSIMRTFVKVVQLGS